MTQEEFIDGVVSMRQYQRYRNGECEITYDKIEQFAEKLGIPIKKLLYEVEREMNKQYKDINSFYNAVVNRNKEQIRIYKELLAKERIIGDERIMLYEYTLIINDYYQNIITKIDCQAHSAELIKFPSILKQKFFTDVEVLVMSSLLDFLEGKEKKNLLEKISGLFNDDEKIMSGEDSGRITLLILMRITKHYGIEKNLPEVIRCCEIGIKKDINSRQFYLLEYFYYYKAIAHFELEEYGPYEEALFGCYSALHVENNKSKTIKFTNLIEEDFNIVLDDFVIKYIKSFK